MNYKFVESLYVYLCLHGSWDRFTQLSHLQVIFFLKNSMNFFASIKGNFLST